MKKSITQNEGPDRLYDCIIIGAGPGGLQAAIYLGRYNRRVLILDRSGGRTWHARHIENVLTHREIAGSEIIKRGIEQAKNFNVDVIKKRVVSITKESVFQVSTADAAYQARFLIVSSGVYDILPPLENVLRFLGTGYFTCVDCDGYKTTNKKLVVTGNSLNAFSLALAMKQMYTRDVTFIPYQFNLPQSFAEVLREEGISVVLSKPVKLIGEDFLEALEFDDGERISCEAVMANFGVRLNDEFLSGLGLKRDSMGFKYVVGSSYESSLSGLYIVGPLNTGHDQVVIAAAEGAVAAIDINKRLLEEAWK
jgi:thioredoxin reductase (NADPH)